MALYLTNANVFLVVTPEMKLTVFFCLFALAKSKALKDNDDDEQTSPIDKSTKRVNVRDNVMKVRVKFLKINKDKILDFASICRPQLLSRHHQKKLQPKSEITLQALFSEICFHKNWKERLNKSKVTKCFNWTFEKCCGSKKNL